MSATCPATASVSWHQANLRYLRQEVARLRLLLRLQAARLRQDRGTDPLADFRSVVISDAEAARLLAGPEPAPQADHAEASAIDAALQALAEDLQRRRRAFAEAGMEAPVDALASQFGLTGFERDVLLLCLAPELEPGLERAYAYLHDDAGARFVSPALALTLLTSDGDQWLEARDSFLASAPLRRFRLVEMDSAPAVSLRPVRLPERVADYLLGVNQLDEEAAPYLRPAPELLLAPSHRRQADEVRAWLAEALRTGRRPLLNLVGVPGAGKLSLARAVCERAGLSLHVLNMARFAAAGAARSEVLRLLEREALLLGSAIYADLAAWDDAGSPGTAAAVSEDIESFQGLLILGSREPWRTAREALTVTVRVPDPAGRHALWSQALGEVAAQVNGNLDGLVEQFEMGPGAIAEAAGRAIESGRLRGNGDMADLLWQSCREQAGRSMDNLAQRIEPRATWDDIVLPADVGAQLRELAAQAGLRRRVYEEWGFGAKLSRGRGISALFSGPSGTGKTMAAEVLAADLRLDLFRIDLASVVSKYIGETEKNLRRIFDAAEQSGAVLFFDEADALFGKRVEVKEGHDRYANIEINYLLQRMEDYRGLAILATNKRSSMDDAFLRRLRFLVEFPAPDASLRRQIWLKAFPAKAAVNGLDYTALSRLDIAGGNIRNIAVNAAFLAAGENRAVAMEHVLHAARREYAKIDKLIGEAEFGPYYERVRR